MAKQTIRWIFDVLGRKSILRPNSETLKIKDGLIIRRRCSKCREWYHISEFSLRPGRLTYSEYCKECRHIIQTGNRPSRVKYRRTKRSDDGLLLYQCSRCKRYKADVEYRKNHTPYHGIDYCCSACRKRWLRLHNKTTRR